MIPRSAECGRARKTHAVAVGNTDLIDRLEIGMLGNGDENLTTSSLIAQRLLESHGKTPVLDCHRRRTCGNRMPLPTIGSKTGLAEAIAMIEVTWHRSRHADRRQRDHCAGRGWSAGVTRDCRRASGVTRPTRWGGLTARAGLYGRDRRHQRRSGAGLCRRGLRHRHRYRCGHSIRRRDVDERFTSRPRACHRPDARHHAQYRTESGLGLWL